MVDTSKIKVGDKINVEMTVTGVDETDKTLPVRASYTYGRGIWIRPESIVGHTPKPHEFKVNDTVWVLGHARLYRIRAVDDDIALIRGEDDPAIADAVPLRVLRPDPRT